MAAILTVIGNVVMVMSDGGKIAWREKDAQPKSGCVTQSRVREGRREMSKPVLAVLGNFTEEVEARIARDFAVRRVSTDAPAGAAANPAEELLRAAEGADAIFFNPPAKLDAEFFGRVARSVKVIATFSVGYDHIDVGAAAARGIAIANTPGVLDDATADVAILLLLGASRRAYEAQELVRSGAWARPDAPRLLGWDCAGKVLGIFGMGRIGQAVARRGRALGMKIHYSNRKRLGAELEGDAVFHARPQELLTGEPVFEFACAAYAGDASFSGCGEYCAAAGGGDCDQCGAGRIGGGWCADRGFEDGEGGCGGAGCVRGGAED